MCTNVSVKPQILFSSLYLALLAKSYLMIKMIDKLQFFFQFHFFVMQNDKWHFQIIILGIQYNTQDQFKACFNVCVHGNLNCLSYMVIGYGSLYHISNCVCILYTHKSQKSFEIKIRGSSKYVNNILCNVTMYQKYVTDIIYYYFARLCFAGTYLLLHIALWKIAPKFKKPFRKWKY